VQRSVVVAVAAWELGLVVWRMMLMLALQIRVRQALSDLQVYAMVQQQSWELEPLLMPLVALSKHLGLCYWVHWL
jgi:hypothetical protein